MREKHEPRARPAAGRTASHEDERIPRRDALDYTGKELVQRRGARRDRARRRGVSRGDADHIEFSRGIGGDPEKLEIGKEPGRLRQLRGLALSVEGRRKVQTGRQESETRSYSG